MVAYAVVRSLPTSFVERMARQLSALPGAKSYSELITQLNKMYGLDSSVLEGFFKWFGYAIRGEFGYSWKFNQPVVGEIQQRDLVLCDHQHFHVLFCRQ
jgi:peptide/nickel transport system permease protein